MFVERNPQMEKAVVKLRELSADERTRDLYERREKARRDQAALEKWAKQQGIQERNIEIAKKLLRRNRPIEEIIEDTGLTQEEMGNLLNTN